MSNYFMVDKDDLQNFFNVMSGNTLYLTDNLKTLLSREITDDEILPFIAALIQILTEMLEEIQDFGHRHELIDTTNGDDNND